MTRTDGCCSSFCWFYLFDIEKNDEIYCYYGENNKDDAKYIYPSLHGKSATEADARGKMIIEKIALFQLSTN